MTNNKSDIVFITFAFIASVLVYWFLSENTKTDTRIDYAVNTTSAVDIDSMDKQSLKDKVNDLQRKIERIQEDKMMLSDKISALQFGAGIEREQTKYLTSNINSHTQMGVPMHGNAAA